MSLIAEKELSRFEVVLAGVTFFKRQYTCTYQWNGAEPVTYEYTEIDAQGEGLELLNNYRILLEYVSTHAEDDDVKAFLEAFDYDSAEQFVETYEEYAADVAEGLEIAFVYERDGARREYTPQSFWEASGGCSWEESAQYGYDYGWNI